MKITSKYTLLYYFSISIVTIGFILLILGGIQWPLSSEIIIGTALFIHGLVLARSCKILYQSAQQKGLISDWIFQLQHGYDMSNSNSEQDA